MVIIDTDSNKTIETTIFKRTLGDMEDKIVEENTGITGMMIIVEVRIDQRHSQETMAIIVVDVQVIVDQDQGLELALIEIG